MLNLLNTWPRVRRGSSHLPARKHEMCDGNFRQLDGAPSSVLRRRRVGRRIKPRHVPNVCMHAVSLPSILSTLPPSLPPSFPFPFYFTMQGVPLPPGRLSLLPRSATSQRCSKYTMPRFRDSWLQVEFSEFLYENAH